MKTLVLGANSFSGQDFVDLMLDDPEQQLIGVSRSPERGELFLRYKGRKPLARFKYHQIDFNKDPEVLLDLLDRERPEAIVNFAALSEVAPSWERPQEWYQTNVVALARLVNHLRRREYLRRYLHVSTPEVYGSCAGAVAEDAPINPSTPYAASKAAADQLLEVYRRQFGFPVLWVRATNVYGARQQLHKIVPRSVIYLKTGRTIELHGGGQAVKSYIHIRDVSRGEKAALLKGKIGEIYHLSPDAGAPVREIVRLICERLGQDFARGTAAVAERPGQDRAYVLDSSKARAELGWAPEVPLAQGLAETIAWIEENWTAVAALPTEYQHKP